MIAGAVVVERREDGTKGTADLLAIRSAGVVVARMALPLGICASEAFAPLANGVLDPLVVVKGEATVAEALPAASPIFAVVSALRR
jgi:hypothetical protein